MAAGPNPTDDISLGDAADVAILRDKGRPRKFRSGATLFHEDDNSDWMR
jgi:hypothetical protein